MFPAKRLLLVVDRSTTHYGKIIAEWLANNHASKSNSKIFIEYIQEGMTSIHQVCDISINKPLKALIKKEYFKFRYDSIKDICAAELAGCVLTVPRENLVEMIEKAFDEINEQNKRRRWIARTFEQCGQDPWSSDLKLFEDHLSSLEQNSVYLHMNETNKQLKLL
jgi:hypothetical protein